MDTTSLLAVRALGVVVENQGHVLEQVLRDLERRSMETEDLRSRVFARNGETWQQIADSYASGRSMLYHCLVRIREDLRGLNTAAALRDVNEVLRADDDVLTGLDDDTQDEDEDDDTEL
jgi:hypothetical protein